MSTRYRLAKGNVVFAGAVVDTETNCWIPFDDANTDYQQYLAWLAEGNEPEPWENQ